jgi:hypothetical protein
MLYGAEVAVCSGINTEHTKCGQKCTNLKCYTCWCITVPVGFKMLTHVCGGIKN